MLSLTDVADAKHHGDASLISPQTGYRSIQVRSEASLESWNAMILCIDVGNSQTTAGVYDQTGTLQAHWQMATDLSHTSDELKEKLLFSMNVAGLPSSSIQAVAIACVVPLLNRRWNQVAVDLTGDGACFVDASQPEFLDFAVPYPQTIGADRIANALAAKLLYGVPVIVVDLGTATDMEVVDKNGAFAGGIIMPGLMLSAQALFSKAAKLSSIQIAPPSRSLGTTTEESMQSGLVLGTACAIDGLVERIEEELSIPDAVVVATGGLCQLVAPSCTTVQRINDHLTLDGIYWFYMKQAIREC